MLVPPGKPASLPTASAGALENGLYSPGEPTNPNVSTSEITPIITAFTRTDHAIAATRRHAICTAVRGVFIAIIAAFTHREDTVAATRFDAGIATGVRIVFIAIVAGFITALGVVEIGAHAAVTATRDRAIAETGVVIIGVAVIAILKIIVAFADVLAQQAIAASRWLA